MKTPQKTIQEVRHEQERAVGLSSYEDAKAIILEAISNTGTPYVDAERVAHDLSISVATAGYRLQQMVEQCDIKTASLHGPQYINPYWVKPNS